MCTAAGEGSEGLPCQCYREVGQDSRNGGVPLKGRVCNKMQGIVTIRGLMLDLSAGEESHDCDCVLSQELVARVKAKKQQS